VEYDAPASAREWSNNALRHVPGIGVSAPEAEPLALDDPTGDDVARDAYRTTGGRTLDDVIDGCRAPRLAVGGAVVSKHAGGISLTSERYERLAVTRADSERRLERASQRRTAEALRRFEREVLSTMERARKVSGYPVIGPNTPVARNKHGEAVPAGDPSAVTGPVGVALEAPQASLGYSFKMMPATSGPERMVSEAVARRAKDVLLQQIQDCIASGLIPESEALPPTLDTLDRPQDEDAVLPELAE
jgi:hypothetical protein